MRTALCRGPLYTPSETMHIAMTATSLRNFSLFVRPTGDQPVLYCSYPCTSVTISNTVKCTHVLLNHHFINTMRNCDMFQPFFKGSSSGNIIDTVQRRGSIKCVTSCTVKLNVYRVLSYVAAAAPRCQNVSIILPEDDPLKVETCCSYVSR